MKSAELDALRNAANLLEAYMKLGSLEELQELRERTKQLRHETDDLREEITAKRAVIKDLNRRIDWMQRYAKERSSE